VPLVPDKLTYFGLPRYTCDRESQSAAGILIGVPSALGTPFENCRNGPYFIRRLSQQYVWQIDEPTLLDLRLRSMSFDGLFDAGDIVSEDDPETLHRELFEYVSAFSPNSVPIAIGGDHSISLPLISAVRAVRSNPVKVIAFDHHLDFQYWSKGRDALVNTNVMTHVSDLVGPGQIVHIGVAPVQTVGALQHDWYLAYLNQVGIQIPLLSKGINDDQFISHTIGKDQDIYLTIDVDVIARSEMQSTGYPSDIGLSLARIIEIIRLIAAENRIVGCDLVEFGAPADDRRQTTLSDASRASTLLLELMIVVVSQRSWGPESSNSCREVVYKV
jgi:arginase family enzyme